MTGIRIKQGVIVSIDESYDDLTVVSVDLGSEETSSDDCSRVLKAYVYTDTVADPQPGDSVLVNTLGVDLRLGTGGYGFVIANLSAPMPQTSSGGHIVRLRYTPYQLSVLAVEEEASPYHDLLSDPTASLEDAPVVSAELHSAVPAIAAGVKAHDPDLSVCYVMTDGGALPLAFSHTVRELRSSGLIQSVITIGHAFGGDYEAVNVFSGLLAAKHVVGADVVIVAKGPGIVGTGTPLGHTGMEQGESANAAFRLGGIPVLTPRIGDSDIRSRHRGISHHFESVLRCCVYCPTYIPVPAEIPEVDALLISSLDALGLAYQHRLVESMAEPGLSLLEDSHIELATMGRSLDEERTYFSVASASGWLASRVAREGTAGLPDPGQCWNSRKMTPLSHVSG